MTTASQTLSYQTPSPKRSTKMLGILMMLVVLFSGVMFLSPSLGQETKKEISDPEIARILTAVAIDPAYSHALEEHPEDAPLVRECLNRDGPYMQFQIIPKQRYLRVCVIDSDKGVIGFQIVDIINKVAKERTAYIKDSIHNIRELLDYVGRQGYCRFKGTL